MSRFSLTGLITGTRFTFLDNPPFKRRPIAWLLMLDMLSSDRHTPVKIAGKRQRITRLKTRRGGRPSYFADKPGRKDNEP